MGIIYEKGKGVCGVLKPNGRFTHCKFGEHYELMLSIPKDIQKKCLWFSSKTDGRDNNSAVGCENWNNGITQKQYNWVISHKEHFDDGELACLVLVFKELIKIV